MIKNLYKEGFTQNRELSWLRFDERCLNEARDSSVPLLERMKFVAIFSSNLDEFFSVRVGSITDLKKYKPESVDNKTGLTPEGQLKKIYLSSNRLCDRREDVFRDLKRALKKEGIFDLTMEECTKEEKTWIKKYFRSIAPLLGGQIVDSRHPLPSLQSGVLYAAGLMKYNGNEVFVLVPVPSSLPKIVRLPSRKGEIRYVHMEDIILENLESVFKGAVIRDRMKFMVIRNADVSVDDDSFEDSEDYRDRMVRMLKKRKRMNPVRIELSRRISEGMMKYLSKYLKAEDRMIYVCNMPMDRKYMFQIAELLPKELADKLSYPPYTPKMTTTLDYSQNLFDQIQKRDVLLSYPYESMDPFLLLIKEAAADPDVVSIKITIYRLARRARLVDYLCLAAENGKEVDVLIELKARFDEQNNIDYSQKLMDAGCTVMYGFEEYKVHSKVCLITRMKDRKASHTALIATGNFNENTAKQYTDLAYLTARPGIVRDTVSFFQNMMMGKLDGAYRYLLVSPVSMKQTICELIDKEAAKKEKGVITCKLNSVTDEEIIYKLSEASKAGVTVRLIVRGICCILPEVKDKTENVHVRSIVGRYLEHSRIYQFGEGRDEKLYISSADFMTRNTERRVEVAVPVADPDIRSRIHDYLDLCFRDNTKARSMDNEGKYHHIHGDEPDFSFQDVLMETTAGEPEAGTQGTIHPAHKAIVFNTTFKGDFPEITVSKKGRKKAASAKTENRTEKKKSDGKGSNKKKSSSGKKSAAKKTGTKGKPKNGKKQ
ncbi:MAG: polyphosphate kinase 1 [Solobacterium sp.]|nr:polyphosphate kinase 1 [Solobacterium sp.]